MNYSSFTSTFIEMFFSILGSFKVNIPFFIIASTPSVFISQGKIVVSVGKDRTTGASLENEIYILESVNDAPTNNDIPLAANTYGFICEDPSIAHAYSTIAGEFAHEICFSWFNNSGECWESYWSGDAYNSDLSIPKNDAYFVLMDGTGETVSCGVRPAGNVAIPVGWYATYLGESTAKTLTQIKTDIQVDGDVTNLYTWDHNAGGTGAWVSVDVAPQASQSSART